MEGQSQHRSRQPQACPKGLHLPSKVKVGQYGHRGQQAAFQHGARTSFRSPDHTRRCVVLALDIGGQETTRSHPASNTGSGPQCCSTIRPSSPSMEPVGSSWALLARAPASSTHTDSSEVLYTRCRLLHPLTGATPLTLQAYSTPVCFACRDPLSSGTMSLMNTCSAKVCRRKKACCYF